MKTLENKAFAEPQLINEGVAAYADLLKICLKNTPEQGFSVETIRIRLKILDKLEESLKEIVFEDSEATECLNAVATMKWLRVSKDVLTFCDDLKKSFN